MSSEWEDEKATLIPNQVLEWRNTKIAIEAGPESCNGSEVMDRSAANLRDEAPLTSTDITQISSLAASLQLLGVRQRRFLKEDGRSHNLRLADLQEDDVVLG